MTWGLRAVPASFGRGACRMTKLACERYHEGNSETLIAERSLHSRLLVDHRAEQR